MHPNPPPHLLSKLTKFNASAAKAFARSTGGFIWKFLAARMRGYSTKTAKQETTTWNTLEEP